MFDKSMAIVDVETTGMSARYHRVIEIAIIRIEGNKIVDSFTSCINPEASIPSFITHLTGISQKDVDGAPVFGKVKHKVKKLLKNNHDLGFVGEIVKVGIEFINLLLNNNYTPVIAPVGFNGSYESFNINADDAASEIAMAIKAVKLVLLTDVKGIMRHKGEESTLISTLAMKDADTLIDRKIIQSGMIPKVRACMNALNAGVSKTHIIDGRIPHSLLLEIFTDKGIGTEIIKDKI